MQLKSLCIPKTISLKKVMSVIDKNGYGLAFVLDSRKHFIGIISDSDIRRALLNGVSLETSVEQVMNTNPVTITVQELNKGRITKEIGDKISPYSSIYIPVLDSNRIVKDIVVANEKGIINKVFGNDNQKPVKRVLVVGGAGYVGSLLCEKLLKKGYRVRVLDNLMYGIDGIKPIFHYPKFEFIFGDVRDMDKVMTVIDGVDAVIHLAAIVGDPASALNPKNTIESNYLATKMLAEVCKYSQINRFIFASTCSVYGAAGESGFLTEKSELNPVSLYAEMKLKSEQGILDLEDENFSPTILRKGTLYGKSHRMRFDLVLNILTIKALMEKQFKIFGGNQYRALCHVSDAADAYVKCLEAPIKKVKGEIFNVVTDNLRISELGKLVKCRIPDAKMIVEPDKEDARDYRVEGNKIWNVLKFKQMHMIVDGIEEIKNAVARKNLYKDYKDPKYSNIDFLRNKK